MSSEIWFAAGIVLLVCEIFVPTGFFLVMLGVASFAVGVLTLLGVLASWTPQAALFCAVALTLWLVYAEKLQGWLGTKDGVDGGVVGQVVVAKEAIAPGARGRGELWGTTWTVENKGDAPIEAEGRCVVLEGDGIVLKVKAQV